MPWTRESHACAAGLSGNTSPTRKRVAASRTPCSRCGLVFCDASIAGASVEAIRHYENQNRGLRNGRFDYSRQLALPSHVLKAVLILIIAAAIAWGQMRDSGFSSSFFSVAFCFCWRAASLDFIAAIAHCVPTNTDAMVFIIGKPT